MIANAAVDEDDAEKALLEKVYGRAASASKKRRFGVRHPCETPGSNPMSMVTLKAEEVLVVLVPSATPLPKLLFSKIRHSPVARNNHWTQSQGPQRGRDQFEF